MKHLLKGGALAALLALALSSTAQAGYYSCRCQCYKVTKHSVHRHHPVKRHKHKAVKRPAKKADRFIPQPVPKPVAPPVKQAQPEVKEAPGSTPPPEASKTETAKPAAPPVKQAESEVKEAPGSTPLPEASKTETAKPTAPPVKQAEPEVKEAPGSTPLPEASKTETAKPAAPFRRNHIYFSPDGDDRPLIKLEKSPRQKQLVVNLKCSRSKTVALYYATSRSSWHTYGPVVLTPGSHEVPNVLPYSEMRIFYFVGDEKGKVTQTITYGPMATKHVPTFHSDKTGKDYPLVEAVSQPTSDRIDLDLYCIE